jgi:hypothetical protein
VLEIGAFILKLVDSVLVLFAFTNQLTVLSIQTLNLLLELTILLLEFSDCVRVLVCGLLVGSKVILQLQMRILRRIMNLRQSGQLFLKLLNLLSVIGLLCLGHL